MRVGFLLLVCAIVWPGAGYAACHCACVNGVVKAVCQSAADLPMICGAAPCDVPPPQLRPPPSRTVPPVGTHVCSQQQVQNSQTGRYEWQTVCR